jgi:hypothetical protein
MATVTKGRTFVSGETLTPSRLNELVDAATVTNIVNADISAGAAITASKLQNPQYTGFRNRIINGNFDIWQRGTSFTASGYGVDRWNNARNVSTCTMSQETFTLGQTDVPNNPTYFCRMTVASSAGASNFVVLQQPIEDVKVLSGQSVTISFYAKADSAKSIALELAQVFGTGGSPSADVTAIGAQKLNLTTSWQKFTATISVPSISGKTLGTNNNHHLVAAIWLDAGSDFNSRTDTLGQQSGTFDIAQVQVEQGTVATPFEARPIGTELALCQRYFEKTFNLVIAPANGLNDPLGAFRDQETTVPSITWRFKVEKRTSPTVTTFNYRTGGANGQWSNGVTDGADALVLEAGTSSASIINNAVLASGGWLIHATASAEL